MLKEAPDRFAAAAPVCSGGDAEAACRFQDVPIGFFTEQRMMWVPPEESQKMVHALEELGAEVMFTLYPEASHNSWTLTYNNPELYTWLLSHSLTRK
ncbi:hypothetical protein AB9P05_18180 [Roseivirga sp. BDSF3-8]|uniref:carboxylesterase family protein n=1 Tax=Roseivirga sp. BDSF3-8 TaxID=3241598 RepID=UPI0035321AA9